MDSKFYWQIVFDHNTNIARNIDDTNLKKDFVILRQ